MSESSFLGLGRNQFWRILSAALMQIFNGCAYIAEIIFISNLISGRLDWQKFILLFLGVLFVKIAASRMLARFSWGISVGVKYGIRKKIFNKVRELGPGYSDSVPTAALIANVMDGVESMEIFFGRFLPQLVYSLIIPLVLFAVTLGIYPLFAIVMLAAVPVMPLSMMFISKWAVKSMDGFWKDFQGLSLVFLENIQGMLTLKLFNQSESRSGEMRERSWEFRNATMALLKMQLTSITVMDTLVYGFAGAGILIALFGFAAGKMGLSSFFVLLMLSVEFFLPLRQLGSQFHAGVNGIQAGRQIVKFLQKEGPDSAAGSAGNRPSPQLRGEGNQTDEENPSGEGNQPDPALRNQPSEGNQSGEENRTSKENQPARATLQPSDWAVEFHNMSFSYGENLPNVLNNLSIRFEPGKIYGISGPSGCGKSTLGRMLLRFHNPTEGFISYGGVPLTSIPPGLLRQNVTLVDTKSRIFDGTIESNLLLADENADSTRMMEVCRKAGLISLVKIPEDLQKKTGEGGSLISSGERQRLAIARAILLNPKIYIFDEAAGSVDAESEQIIRETIYSLAGENTVFIISHRMSMLQGVDKHFVLQGGRLCLK